MSLRIAALVKQIPAFESMTLGGDGRLVREGLELEMSAYCRRAVSQAVRVAAGAGGRVTVITLGPPTAEDVLREAIAWGRERDVEIAGVLVTDPRFAGSDTLATSRALAATIDTVGPFDLILTGRNSVDADTGQVGPQLAELLGLPFVTGARHFALADRRLDIRAEHDDGWAQIRVDLPAIVSTAERLVDPCKVDRAGRAAVPAHRLRTLTAGDLGPGPWGAQGSPTSVGETRVVRSDRLARRDAGADLDDQVGAAVGLLAQRHALDADRADASERASVPPPGHDAGRLVGVVVEPDRARITRELLGAAAQLGGPVVALGRRAGRAGRGRIMGCRRARGLHPHPRCERGGHRGRRRRVGTGGRAVGGARPQHGVGARGRESGGRGAGDGPHRRRGRARTRRRCPRGVEARVRRSDRRRDQVLDAPADGDRPHRGAPRARAAAPRRATTTTIHPVTPRSRLRVLARTRDDDLDLLADARAVVAVGQGVDPADYPLLDDLLATLDAELAATRKVTDHGWMPRARQLGITGRTIAPRLLVSIGASGKFNHMVGFRTAGTVVAINADPDALVHDAADVSIVGDYRDVLPRLTAALRARRCPRVTRRGQAIASFSNVSSSSPR